MPTYQATRRQQQVLDLIIAGMSNKQIATRLGLSESAVKQHISQLLRNFGVRTRTALVSEALHARSRVEERRWHIDLAMVAPMAIAVTRGPEHVYEYVNEEFVRQTGQAHVIGRPFLEVFPGLDEHPVKVFRDVVFRSGRPAVRQQVLSRLPDVSGKERIRVFEVSCHPICDDTGAVEGVVTFSYDLTERIEPDPTTGALTVSGAVPVATRAVDGLRAIHEVARMTGAHVDRLALVGGALALIRSILQVPSAALFAARTDGSQRLLLDDNRLTRPKIVTVPRGSGVAGQALVTRGPIVVNEYQRWEHALPAIRDQVDAAAAVPVERNGLAIGVLAVHARGSRIFTIGDTDILSMFAVELFEDLESLRAPGDTAELRSGPATPSAQFTLARERVSG